MLFAIKLVLILATQIHAQNNSIVSNLIEATKCFIPNGVEDTLKALLLQQCLSETYAQGNETRCYDELGCFPMNYPWTSYLRPFPSPQDPAEIRVALQCFTRKHPKTMEMISLWPEIKLNNCSFDANRKTAFLIHGFVTSGNYPFIQEFKDRYLEQVDANFFIVDWAHAARMLNYLQAASNIRIVAAEVKRFIHFMQKNFDLKAEDLHMIGHSLGAHIAGYVGKDTPGLGRITALDPAQPGFEGTDPLVRLHKGDAQYVEAVHTNAAPFIPLLGFGMIRPVGHVDFYIDGGMHQVGCEKMATPPEFNGIEDLRNVTFFSIYQLMCCSHCRSYEYYMRVLSPNCVIWGRLSSFKENLFNAGSFGLTEEFVFSKLHKCTPETCLPLCLDTPKYPARGVFAATTYIEEPFCETDPEVNERKFKEIGGN